MNETLKVTGLDKMKSDFEKNMPDFEKSKENFEKYMAALEMHLSKFAVDDSKAEDPCIELDPQDVDAVELTKSLGADTVLIVRKKTGAEVIVDGLDGTENEDGKNADGLDGTKNEDKGE